MEYCTKLSGRFGFMETLFVTLKFAMQYNHRLPRELLYNIIRIINSQQIRYFHFGQTCE